MSPAELDAYRAMEAGMIRGPYLVIAGIFVVMAAIFWRAHLPEVAEDERRGQRGRLDDGPTQVRGQSIWSHPHLLRGVIAQFLYVGAQVGVASFVIRFVQRTHAGDAGEDSGRVPDAGISSAS